MCLIVERWSQTSDSMAAQIVTSKKFLNKARLAAQSSRADVSTISTNKYA